MGMQVKVSLIARVRAGRGLAVEPLMLVDLNNKHDKHANYLSIVSSRLIPNSGLSNTHSVNSCGTLT